MLLDVCVDGWVTVVCVWFPMWYMCLSERGVHVWMWSTERLFSHREGLSCMYVVSGPFGRVHPPLHAFNVHISLMWDKNDWCGHRLRPNHTHPLCLIIFLERWLHHMCVAFVCVCVKLWCIIYLLPYTGIVVKGVDYCFMIICLLFLLFVDYSSAVSDAHHTETGH